MERNDGRKQGNVLKKSIFPNTFFVAFRRVVFPPVLACMLLKDGVVERNHPTNSLMRWMLSQAKRQGSLVSVSSGFLKGP